MDRLFLYEVSNFIVKFVLPVQRDKGVFYQAIHNLGLAQIVLDLQSLEKDEIFLIFYYCLGLLQYLEVLNCF